MKQSLTVLLKDGDGEIDEGEFCNGCQKDEEFFRLICEAQLRFERHLSVVHKLFLNMWGLSGIIAANEGYNKPPAMRPCKNPLTPHLFLPSACTHECLSNLSCVGRQQDGTGGAAVQSSDRERGGAGDRLLICLAQQLTLEHIYIAHFGMQKCDIFNIYYPQSTNSIYPALILMNDAWK